MECEIKAEGFSHAENMNTDLLCAKRPRDMGIYVQKPEVLWGD
jgi:hypothetical protein